MGNILDAKTFFRANVSDEILATIVKKIQGGSRDAASRICGYVREGIYTKRVARDLFPYVRRGTIETRLFDLASKFPDVIVTSELNKTKTNYHTLIRVGNVILTASAVLTPYGIVREASFRNSYAGRQMRLFDLDNGSDLSVAQFVKEPFSDDLLYGIILYCAADNNIFDVGSVRVGFPNANCTNYLDKMDLTRLFPETTKKTEVEQIQDQAVVNLLLDEETLPFARAERSNDGTI